MDALTVSQVINRIKNLIESQLDYVTVVGELINLSSSGAGHWYFSLTDSNTILAAALFRMDAHRNPLIKKIKSGDKVVCHGKINVYPKKGTFQLIVNSINPIGKGELKEKFELLKTKLAREGLFDLEKKKKIPKFPKKIGIITSIDGAAIQDFLKIYKRRSLWNNIIVCPALVQGEQSSASLRKALEKMIRYDLQSSPEQKLDALILSRGGGSLEDLWSFNDEGLAWDIFNCPIPVISAVGHEVDFTISDYVSDFRCETPSAAAELLSEGQVQLRRQLLNYKKGLISSTEKKIGYFQRRTELHAPNVIMREIWKLFNIYQRKLQRFEIKNRLFELVKIHEKSQRLDDLSDTMFHDIDSLMLKIQNNLETKFEMLRLLDPDNILGRGYSYLKHQRKVVSNYERFDKINEGEELEIVFQDGKGKVQKIQ
ncbi:exodeoxyribonuclease VII large subunit [Bacteriovoracales bacterium]|nr:exodeoxyribonuclease VII large subunit [Bacteriovoracales bacterium]